jgi:hypothetical protein
MEEVLASPDIYLINLTKLDGDVLRMFKNNAVFISSVVRYPFPRVSSCVNDHEDWRLAPAAPQGAKDVYILIVDMIMLQTLAYPSWKLLSSLTQVPPCCLVKRFAEGDVRRKTQCGLFFVRAARIFQLFLT